MPEAAEAGAAGRSVREAPAAAYAAMHGVDAAEVRGSKAAARADAVREYAQREAAQYADMLYVMFARTRAQRGAKRPRRDIREPCAF